MRHPRSLFLVALLLSLATRLPAQQSQPTWTFAVSGDSRNCGDFVMPAIATKVKAEHDVLYWHLGDFRWMSQPDEDLIAMEHAGNPFTQENYRLHAWDDFLVHQMASFGTLPVFLGRGNHETVPPMTRDGYTQKFAAFLNRPEIAAQRQADGANGAPLGPWYHWIQDGVDFITLDNASHDEFSDAQLHWLRSVLDRDLAPNSGVRAILAGMHEALPHSSGSEHAMDDWDLGLRSGELVYTWFYDAQAAGNMSTSSPAIPTTTRLTSTTPRIGSSTPQALSLDGSSAEPARIATSCPRPRRRAHANTSTATWRALSIPMASSISLFASSASRT